MATFILCWICLLFVFLHPAEGGGGGGGGSSSRCTGRVILVTTQPAKHSPHCPRACGNCRCQGGCGLAWARKQQPPLLALGDGKFTCAPLAMHKQAADQ